MDKRKKLAWLLAVAALILTMPVLPTAAARWQDGQTLGKPAFGQMQTVELEILPNRTILEKLALVSGRGSWLNIEEDKATMTWLEAEQAFLDAFQPYVDAGLMQSFDRNELRSFIVQPRWISTPEGDGVIVWTADISRIYKKDAYDYLYISAVMDDATGKLLRLNYNVDSKTPNSTMAYKLTDFADIYFPALGIEDYTRYLDDSNTDTYKGENCRWNGYIFRDTSFGQFYLDMYVHSYGFYTEMAYSWEVAEP